MTGEQRYATPVALRAAITDRLRSAAAIDPSRSFPDLLRQFAYDRLLYRVFTNDDAGRWVLKGATALLARLHGHARHSIDVDLYDRVGDLHEAEAALKKAAERDVGDHFRFVLAPGRRIAEVGDTLRVSATAYLGATEFARFNVDLVAGTGMTGQPEVGEPLVTVELPGVPVTNYRLYPLADHVADKVFAIVEQHARQNAPPIASTRYRDLADLVMIARREVVKAKAVETALRAQAQRRPTSRIRAARRFAVANWVCEGCARCSRSPGEGVRCCGRDGTSLRQSGSSGSGTGLLGASAADLDRGVTISRRQRGLPSRPTSELAEGWKRSGPLASAST